MKVRYGVIANKDIHIRQLSSNIKASMITVQDYDLTIKQLKDEREIIGILQEFDTIFFPSITDKVDNLKEYSTKLSGNAFVFVAKLKKNLGFVTLYANDHASKIG